jgi:transcriptional regulator of arginine metabolism
VSAQALRAMAPATKPARHRAILDLVRTRAIRTQEELVAQLHRRHLDVTQATVSRDIRELGLLRVHESGGPRYMAPAAELDVETSMVRLRNALREHVRMIEFVDLFGVIHAAPGTAPLVAGAIDGARFDEVAGTVAGDDTVFILARSRPAGQRLLMRLTSMGGREG